MKVGIITLQGNMNYGNRLQNYAVSEIMKCYGVETDTLVVKNKEDFLSSGRQRSIKKRLSIYLIVLCSRCKKLLCKNKYENKREFFFQKFNTVHMNIKTYYINQYRQLFNIKNLQKYDYILTGSDQVWNPDFGGSDLYFLTFVPPEKRIGFIASIGVSKLPAAQKKRYAALLGQMRYISVREESAVQIIEQLIHRKVDCFFDPVLLLEKKNWENIVEPVTSAVPERYVLSFFLGEEPKEKIEIFADSKNLEIVHMNQNMYPQYYTLNPAQLLYMIKNAEYILTDSFHVTAFSIIFQKQFFVFRRKQENMENMFSRMETLLGRLGLMERIQDASQIEETGSISEEQYREIAKMLVMERKRLDETMKKVLK